MAQSRNETSLRLSSELAELLLMVAMFVSILALFAVDWRYSLSNGNYFLKGGVSTIGAERVLAGDIPYRDFWTMYAPGHFYLLALLFQIFGTTLIVEVVAASAISAATVYVCYRLAFNIVGRRLLSLVPALVFFAAIYNTAYFKRLGSYPPSALLILLVFNLIVLHLKSDRLRYLIAAGVLTGLAVLFKHDVAGYTAVAVVVGTVAFHFTNHEMPGRTVSSLLRKLAIYATSAAVVVIPVLLYFVISAGPDMLQDLIIFPLTDFRYARPEGYPGLLPLGLLDRSLLASRLQLVQYLANYVIFTVPFVLLLLGLLATGLAARRRKSLHFAAGMMFGAGFLLHYMAAHVQINTHIVTMSVYAALLGVMVYDLFDGRLIPGRPRLQSALMTALVVGWILALAAQPVYVLGMKLGRQTVELMMPKVAGFKVSPEEANNLTNLTEFVDSHIEPDEMVYVGLRRHDVIVIGDVMIYHILNRPIPTRYHELHPAIADTRPVQEEIIDNLQSKAVRYVILRPIFSDEVLEEVKSNFKKNLPQIGATELDTFIRENFVKIQQYGPYSVWERREAADLNAHIWNLV